MSDATAGSGNIERRDIVSVNGRQGIVNIDLRPEHNFVQVVWLDEREKKRQRSRSSHLSQAQEQRTQWQAGTHLLHDRPFVSFASASGIYLLQ